MITQLIILGVLLSILLYFLKRKKRVVPILKEEERVVPILKRKKRTVPILKEEDGKIYCKNCKFYQRETAADWEHCKINKKNPYFYTHILNPRGHKEKIKINQKELLNELNSKSSGIDKYDIMPADTKHLHLNDNYDCKYYEPK